MTSSAAPIYAAPAIRPSAKDLVLMLRDSRARTLELVAGLNGAQLLGPMLGIVNPLLWEIGHLAWFHEHFVPRYLDNAAPVLEAADALYDSSAVPHDTRWDLPLPSLADTLDYMRCVEARLVARLEGREPTEDERYLYRLVTFHEDMHGEAFTYSRQSLGYPAPRFAGLSEPVEAGPLQGDVAIPGALFHVGAEQTDNSDTFAFDNEKWAHPVEVAPFRMARAPVTNEAFAAFVADGGYRKRDLWADAGWAWRTAADARHPIYWQVADDGRYEVRRFDALASLAPHQPVVNVSWYEADAYCRWAGRRLPTEVEWELVAATAPGETGRRRYAWGDTPDAGRANLDGYRLGCCDVAAFPKGDSAYGCRQMIGNVWEWTSSDFLPYPGFSPDIYRDYSVPAFGSCKVLRGGAWITRARMITNTYRNYFPPGRNDIYAGFRTVAVEGDMALLI